jgi:hypothetical protein
VRPVDGSRRSSVSSRREADRDHGRVTSGGVDTDDERRTGVSSTIELRLIGRLQAMASESMRTALRVAGNRLKNRAQGNPCSGSR